MIEIIPKPAAKIPFWLNILFYSSIVLLIAVISSFFVLNHFIKKSTDTLQDLETALARERTPSKIALEKEIFSYQKKIEDLASLLKEHLASSQVFEFLERVTHPRVWFLNFDFSSRESRVKVSGITESFQTLGQQIFILKKNPLVKDLNLSGVSIGKEGEIVFTIDLLLDPQIFTP